MLRDRVSGVTVWYNTLYNCCNLQSDCVARSFGLHLLVCHMMSREIHWTRWQVINVFHRKQHNASSTLFRQIVRKDDRMKYLGSLSRYDKCAAVSDATATELNRAMLPRES